MAKAFHKDFSAKGLKRFAPEDFVDQSYPVLLEEEIDRKVNNGLDMIDWCDL